MKGRRRGQVCFIQFQAQQTTFIWSRPELLRFLVLFLGTVLATQAFSDKHRAVIFFLRGWIAGRGFLLKQKRFFVNTPQRYFWNVWYKNYCNWNRELQKQIMWPLPLHSRKFNFNCPSKPVAYKKRHQNCTKVYMKTESYIVLILSFKIARFSSSCHLQGDLANSLTDEFKKKNNSNYNGFCARRSTTLWTRYDVILVPIRWLTSFCLNDNIKGLACSFKSLHVFSFFVVCVRWRYEGERSEESAKRFAWDSWNERTSKMITLD